MLRAFAVALAVSLPLAAQTVRIDAVVVDLKGNRVRGMLAADFEVFEGGEKRPIVDFAEYALGAIPAAPVTDTNFVPLGTSAVPTPPRRLVFLFDANATAADREAAKDLVRPIDIVTMDGPIPEASVPSRVAMTVAQLAQHPERKAIILFGPSTPEMAAFANRRGIALFDRTQLADAAVDLGSYYAITVRAANPKALQIRTTRQLVTMRAVVNVNEVDVADAVLAHHLAEPASNDLGIALRADPPVVNAEGKRQVRLHVLIPIRSLTLANEGADMTGGFDVYVSTGDAAGRVTPANKQTHAIKWPAESVPKAGNIDYVFTVAISPANSRISVGVVDHRSKKTGFARIEL